MRSDVVVELAAAFVLGQSAGALDDLAEMFIKRMLAIHQKGKEVFCITPSQSYYQIVCAH